MKIASFALAVWSIWAGHTMVYAGHAFGVLLPIAGMCGILAAFTLDKTR